MVRSVSLLAGVNAGRVDFALRAVDVAGNESVYLFVMHGHFTDASPQPSEVR